jgi:zinc transport system substrate-binding protein
MPRIVLLLLLLSLLVISCSQPESDPAETPAGRPTVASVNYPLHYFAGRIGGPFFEAQYPVPDDVDPAFWNPGVEEIALFQEADIILTNGADYAKWLGKVSLPTARMVNTSEGFRESYIELTEGMTHTHGPEGAHEHLGYAFTTWLDFKLALAQAEAVKEALVRQLPDKEEALEENFGGLKADLIALDERATSSAAYLESSTIYASHPVYQYFARGYGLSILSEHWEPGEMPDETQWEALAARLQESPAQTMLWEGEPLTDARDRLQGLGLTVTVFQPCGNRPPDGDFLSVMHGNLDRLAEGQTISSTQ